jgi:hypothetical protein
VYIFISYAISQSTEDIEVFILDAKVLSSYIHDNLNVLRDGTVLYCCSSVGGRGKRMSNTVSIDVEEDIISSFF